MTFEHIAPFNGSADVPDGYKGLNWTNVTAIGRGLVESTYPHSGFASVIHGNGVASVVSSDGVLDSRITAPANTTFNVKGGFVACAWNAGESLTFTAIRRGTDINIVFVLDKTPSGFHLPGFHGLTELRITALGGADADGSDGGSGMEVALDNLKFVIHPDAHPAHHAAFDHALMADVIPPHISDWPLA